MKDLLNRLFKHETLSYQEAKNAVSEIARGEHNASQIASFLTIFCLRSIKVEELMGFRDAMLELCKRIDLTEFDPIDIVGTGGDGKNTFNISTLASFITAGAGYKVAKHGNYGVSSGCGSSNVLEYLGVPFSNEERDLKRMLEKSGFCMMHAPLFHPAMKNVGPIRKEMQVRTFFNMLGPILNPAFVNHQLLGVYNLSLLRLYGYLHQDSNKNYSIVHALDGYDEVSLTCSTKIINNKGEHLLEPRDLGFTKIKAEDLFGGETVESSAKIFVSVLNNEGTEAQNAVVLANSALAINTIQPEKNYDDCLEEAKASLVSGKAKNVLSQLTSK